VNPVDQLVSHWKEIYNSNSPEKELLLHDGEVPKEITHYFQFELYPEPFYGYLNDVLSNDALLLLINPGEFKGNAEEISRLNSFTKERYTIWTKREYLNEKDLLRKIAPKSIEWRNRKKKQVERVIPNPKKVNFLHTMELFPYHSKNWTGLSERAKSWMLNTKTTKLNFEAIKYLTVARKINNIIGIGINWLDIFERFGYQPTYYQPFYNDKGNFTHRVFSYQLSEAATPIIIYVANSMHLPKDPNVIKCFEKLLKV